MNFKTDTANTASRTDGCGSMKTSATPIVIAAKLTKLQVATLCVLWDGRPHFALEISNRLRCDSRSIIRYLRNAGYSIHDRWTKQRNGRRAKIYWINLSRPLAEPSTR
ncbi:MAG: hypothetical protein LIO90_08315 [Bacteroidales bacterium]|nr:hypothetical protein [Bacteroidales bacterium]